MNPGADTKRPFPLRRVAVWDEEKEREIVFLTESPRPRRHDDLGDLP